MFVQSKYQTINAYVAKRIRVRRCLLGISVRKFSSQVGIKYRDMCKYESGHKIISPAMLWRFAQTLNVPIGYFYLGIDTPICLSILCNNNRNI